MLKMLRMPDSPATWDIRSGFHASGTENIGRNSLSEAFRVSIASDQEHEKVVAEVYFGDKFVLLVSKDHETPIVELPGTALDESCVARMIPLEGLQDALIVAAQRLNE